MNVVDTIRKRRSTRRYKPDEIPQEVLDRLLNAMRLAPSGGNRQPWKFIVVRDEAIKAELAAACQGGRFLDQASVVIVACGCEEWASARYRKDGQIVVVYAQPVPQERESLEYLSCFLLDLAIALDHLTLTTAEEGLGTCWVGALDERKLKELLSVPDDIRVPIVMPIGYPVEWPDAKPRKPLEEIICYDKYSER